MKYLFLFFLFVFLCYVIYRLMHDTAAIKRKDPACKRPFEVILYASFWALLFHRIAHRMHCDKFFFLARLVSQFSRFCTGVEIHPGAVIGKDVFIDHGTGVVIGETAVVGDNVTIYQGVTLGGTGKDSGKRHPTIGDNVLIGAGAKVLGPITIGDNCKIGAGSVVLNDVPEFATVVGVPGRIVKRANITEIPADCLDQRLSDPEGDELESLLFRISELEAKIALLEGGKLPKDKNVSGTDIKNDSNDNSSAPEGKEPQKAIDNNKENKRRAFIIEEDDDLF